MQKQTKGKNFEQQTEGQYFLPDRLSKNKDQNNAPWRINQTNKDTNFTNSLQHCNGSEINV
jgi:hypothetical protein